MDLFLFQRCLRAQRFNISFKPGPLDPFLDSQNLLNNPAYCMMKSTNSLQSYTEKHYSKTISLLAHAVFPSLFLLSYHLLNVLLE